MTGDTTPQDPATLLRNTLAVLHMRQVDLAKRAGLSAKHVNQIAKGVKGITPDVALKFERVTGVPAMEWNRVNAAYQVGLLRRRPRVWWSESQGVLEELPGAVRDPVRVIRVTSNVVLDEFPADAVELLPADAGLLCSSPVVRPQQDEGRSAPEPSAAGEVLADDEPIHEWFGLSYSSYLVLHRTLLQSMPGQWQREFVHLLEQMHAAFGHVEQTECYDLIPGTEALVNELSDDQRKRLGITSSIDDLTEEQYEEWLNQPDNEVFYEDKDGQALEGYSRVVLPGAELIPPYSKGRTRVDVDMDAYLEVRRG